MAVSAMEMKLVPETAMFSFRVPFLLLLFLSFVFWVFSF